MSGANVNFDRLRHIAELAELGEKREVLLGATIPERPGSFRRFCHAIGTRGITEFNYRYSDSTNARVFAGVQLRPVAGDKAALMLGLQAQGIDAVDMSDNELAKMHVRHMVGGHAGALQDERVLRVEFPERPGALLHFLNQVGDRWNISLFHYRNHGAAYGRVLMGLQVPAEQSPAFEEFLAGLKRDYVEEVDNVAYELFLR